MFQTIKLIAASAVVILLSVAIFYAAKPQPAERVLAAVTSAPVRTTFWNYQCMDTMKYSRDTARAWNGKEAQLQQLIAKQLDDIADMGANCVALGTPYDEEFAPFLAKWVAAARQRNLTIWFRGNIAEWEGWFDRARLRNPSDHHKLTAAFIAAHPDLFVDGDIFTPAPEAENGALGNPWASFASRARLRDFLEDSYDSCLKAFTAIHKNVRCGYFSANGDVAEQIFTKDMVDKTGGRVVVDHYVKEPERLIRDIVDLNEKFKVPVFLGEFGAPIPDIHGRMNETEQADYIRRDLEVLASRPDIIEGINYWVTVGGSTELVTGGKQRAAAEVIKNFFKPATVRGVVADSAGEPLAGATIEARGSAYRTTSNENGEFALLVPAGMHLIDITHPGYSSLSMTRTLDRKQVISHLFILQPERPGFGYKLKTALATFVRTVTQ